MPTTEPSNDGAARRGRGRALRLVAAVPLTAFAVGLGTGLTPAPALAADPAPVPVDVAKYEGFATASFLHVDALKALLDPASVADVDVAESAAAVRSEAAGGLKAIKSQLNRPVSPANAEKNSSALATSVEVALAGTPTPIKFAAEPALAPPTLAKPNTSSAATVPAATIAYAAALPSTTMARYTPNDCILGADISNGLARAADAQLLGASANPDGTLASPTIQVLDPTTGNTTVSTTSRQRLVAQTNAAGQRIGNAAGLLAETDIVLAPIQIAGVGTITLAGTYKLKAVATGLTGGAYVLTEQPKNPVVTFVPTSGEPLVITVADLLGPVTPVTQPLFDALAEAGIADIDIAPAPKITTAPDGTSAAATVDLVKITLADGGLGTIVVGHAEVSAQVPAGGIACPGVKVAKTSSADPVMVGEAFQYKITVTNPYDCRLTNVKVVDKVTPESGSGITFTLGDTTPASSSKTSNTVTWNDIGPIDPRGEKSVELTITVDGARVSGKKLIDDATVTADCAIGSAQDNTSVTSTALMTLPLTGEIRLVAPTVNREGATRGVLPETGGRQDAPLVGAGLLAIFGILGAEVLRRRRSEG